MIVTLVANLKNGIDVLLPAFSELPIATNPQQNAKRLTANRYTVVPGSISETASVNKFYTCNQTFILRLTNDYVKRQGDDSIKQSTTNALMDNALDVYKAIVQNKAWTPASVMNVRDLFVDAPIYFEEEDTILIEASFIITYRVAI